MISECEVKQTDEESLCCHESDIIGNVRKQAQCITFHKSFSSVVIFVDCLNTARFSYIIRCKTVEDKKKFQNLSNRLWRHIAYKQFVYWMNSWNPLGKFRRIVIPSCVVKTIRIAFPEPSGQYVGFKTAAAEGAEPEYFD